MSDCFKYLPGEILKVIFKGLTAQSKHWTVSQCQLVCKAWHDNAQRCLYEVIPIYNLEKLVNMTLIFKKSPNGSSPGKYTRQINCEYLNFAFYDYDEADNQTMGHKWVSYYVPIFPNMRNLNRYKGDRQYFLRLIEAHSRGDWHYLEDIGSSTERDVDVYNACAILHSKTLKQLQVYDFSGICCNFYDQLQLFPAVTKLGLKTNQRSFYEFAEYITQIGRNFEMLHYRYWREVDYDQLTPYQAVDLESITPCLAVKTLLLYNHSYENDNFLLYLMKKFPNLNTFYSNTYKKGDRLQHIVLRRLKLSKNKFTIPVVSQFISFVEKCKTGYMDRLFVTFKVEEFLNYHWDTNQPKVRSMGIEYSDRLERIFDRNRVVNYNDPLVQIKANTEYGLTRFGFRSHGTHMPHYSILQQCGHRLDHLYISIDLDQGEMRTLKAVKIVMGGFLCHLLHYCTTLKSLHIQNSYLIGGLSIDPPYINKSVTEMKLQSVHANNSVFPILSRLLPSLTRLILDDIWGKEDRGYLDHHMFHYVIDMPYTSLKFLYIKNHCTKLIKTKFYPSQILIKLSTKTCTRYYGHFPAGPFNYNEKYVIKSKTSIPSTEEITNFPRAIEMDERNYKRELSNNRRIKIHIKCQSLDYLAVSFDKIHPSMTCHVLNLDERSIRKRLSHFNV